MTKQTDNTIVDYISGLDIKATPEEVEAVEVFARQLVEDYAYPKTHIQTHPQHRVKIRPSDTKKEYPIDIGVFQNAAKNEDDLYIVVECKKSNRKDGKSQLQNYLTLSNAYLGVWFNGEERIFIRKYITNKGEIYFEEIPNIPKFGQRIEDIGKFTRQDLRPTHNLKAIFKSIRNYLAANTVGATRDEVLAQQLINIIFCKLYDEKHTAPTDIVRFRAGIGETPQEIVQRVRDIFEEVKTNLPEVIERQDQINLDTKSIVYVVGELQNYSLMNSERDVIADAFETFIGQALKGGQGQFFTPRNVVKMIVDILQPNENDRIIDPACGSGGFLIDALKSVWEKTEQKYQQLGWSVTEIEKRKIQIATKNFRGLDKDYFLSKVAKAYMNLVGDGTTGIFCEDSLELPQNWSNETRSKIHLGEFDMVLTNPPFGKNIKVEGREKLLQYEVGHKWKYNEENKAWKKDKLKESEAPEILFIERCLQLLKEGGKMGIVLPDGFFNENVSYLRHWLLAKVKILAIIDIPMATFQPNTSTKTSVLFFEKNSYAPQNYPIFMAVAHFCGHNRRGKPIEQDDIPTIIAQYHQYLKQEKFNDNDQSFIVQAQELQQTNFWIPKHFSPYYQTNLNALKQQYEVVQLGTIANLQKGDEVGSDNYIPFIEREATDVPFLRTGDLVNYSVNQFADNFLDEQLYIDLQQDLQANDILYTKDGKIGITAMLTPNDKVVIASGIVRIRLTESAQKQYGFTQEYLFAILSDKFLGYFQAIRRTVIAATIPHLREKRLAEFEIPILSKETINEITTIVQQSFDLKNQSKALDHAISKFFLLA
jgi:type I restriction enzyme M protein